MKKFKQFVTEAKYPTWVRTTVTVLSLKIANLEKQISRTTDDQQRDILLARQNKLISYMTALSVAVSTDDENLIKRLQGMGKK